MELIYGKHAEDFSAVDLWTRAARFQRRMIDLGTGDGRFVLAAAASSPDLFAIGIDACRENLRVTTRRAPHNALFIAANAISLPHELSGFADRLTINFPWGSLLDVLAMGEISILAELLNVCRPGAQVEVRLNESALAEAGLSLSTGWEKVCGNLTQAGISGTVVKEIGHEQLRLFPSTWARKMAFGRLPCGILICGKMGA